jgi:PHD/YefM family antitoxin component YafN of YafNO toxin-antitoxin module
MTQRAFRPAAVPSSGKVSLLLHLDTGTPSCCDVLLSVHLVTMALMSELPAGDTHDVIRRRGQVVAVVVPIEEYQQLRQAMQEQQVNEEFDAARARYLARREAGAIRYVSHEEAGRRLGMPSR